MLKAALPEEVGVRSRDVHAFISSLEKRKIPMHSLLLMRGDRVFLDCYWAPFHRDRTHRMYSVTKSFVSVAVGLAEEDGLIDLDKRISDYFPEKIHPDMNRWLWDQTIRQMLTMTTAGGPPSWFRAGAYDRTEYYFSAAGRRPSGTLWEYDSSGSQVLSSLVEKMTGKRLFDYLNERIFRKLDAFQSAKMLCTPNGDAWGDSALICTPRDLATFARFVMNYGEWNGERLMNEHYLRTATSALVSNAEDGHYHVFSHGYGYQFWRTEEDGFAFVGMGNQICVCLPKQDLIMVLTADCQGNTWARQYLIAQFMDLIAARVENAPLMEEKGETQELIALTESLRLHAATGLEDSPMRQALNGVRFACEENNLGWKEFSLHFESAEAGELRYTKGERELVLPFYVNRNRFGKFPELGYSREFGGVRTTDGHRYDDAVSLAWLQEDRILLFAQIIDDYFGNLSLIFSFKDDLAAVRATKTAEDFLWDYQGEIVAKQCK